MPVVGIRELARDVSGLVERVENGEFVLITKHGRYVAALVRIDPDGLEDFLLGHLPEFIESMEQADRDFAAERTVPFETWKASRRKPTKAGRSRGRGRAG